METKRLNILDQIKSKSTQITTKGDEQLLHELRRKYDEVVRAIFSAGLTLSCDIMDIFPSEIWIPIIEYSLPSDGYNSSLLLLTMVSNKWMRMIVSVPCLWSHIEICSLEEDSMAKIKTFIHLSGVLPLTFTMRLSQSYPNTAICDLLRGIEPRVYEMTFSTTFKEPFVRASRAVVVIQSILTTLGCFSNLVRVRLDQERGILYDLTTGDYLMKYAHLMPRLRAVEGWPLELEDFQHHHDDIQHMEEIESNAPIEDVLNGHIQFDRLSRLEFNGHRHAPTRNMRINAGILTSIRNLTSFSYSHSYCTLLIDILSAIAPRLQELGLLLPFSKVDSLCPILERAFRLKELSISIDDIYHGELVDEERSTSPTGLDATAGLVVIVPSLQVLKLSINSYKEDGIGDLSIQNLFQTFAALYANTRILDLKFSPKLAPPLLHLVLEYVSKCKLLKSLHFDTANRLMDYNNVAAFQLDTLEMLDAMHSYILRPLKAPNLERLNLEGRDVETIEEFRGHSICVTYAGLDLQSSFRIPPEKFSQILDLTLKFNYNLKSRFGDHLTLTSLPFLTTITILAASSTCYSTSLCFELLCHPDYFPSLQTLKFPDSMPALDVLFTMLEKRNLLANRGISRIRRITLQFIAEELRRPLSLLLAGIFPERLRGEDLLFGGSWEAILDEKLPGCLTCLLNMMPTCRQPARDQFASTAAEDILWIMSIPQVAEYPSKEISEWALRRDALVKMFHEQYRTWATPLGRSLTCFWRDTSPVEIGEYGYSSQN
ncbi:hypothetical protein M408DRAFT_169309 [Serendipita vermifera MAFF 305830]|uniref:F-box domain-containing protein n=1 Tax=Serendipita vermifera MAFF 305830 TaxID=933852 RepID=A0A0C2WM38_SERVB|nr:hypothetical protein M408DRAFT_169309 [Serendipita vermifera MAFF 305830]